MLLWEDSLVKEVAERIAATPVPVPWRCGNCGMEGSITKAPDANETLRRLLSHHERLSPRCQPRILVVDPGGRVLEVTQ
jgi:hypothetical protein